MKILLTVDQSWNSLAAAHWVQGPHLQAGSVVYLLNVVEIKQWLEWSACDDARDFRHKMAAVREL